MDSRDDEQEHAITMKGSSIDLLHKKVRVILTIMHQIQNVRTFLCHLAQHTAENTSNLEVYGVKASV